MPKPKSPWARPSGAPAADPVHTPETDQLDAARFITEPDYVPVHKWNVPAFALAKIDKAVETVLAEHGVAPHSGNKMVAIARLMAVYEYSVSDAMHFHGNPNKRPLEACRAAMRGITGRLITSARESTATVADKSLTMTDEERETAAKMMTKRLNGEG